MKVKYLTLFLLIVLLNSCNKNIYGIYNTKYSTDKSSFMQIKLNLNKTVEKNEIHTIRIDSKGTWISKNDKIICFLDSTETGFPVDTLILKIIGNKMFFESNGKINKSYYLKKAK